MSVTLGPKGRNVLVEQPFGAPKITKDGVTVAQAVEFADHQKNLGAQLIREVWKVLVYLRLSLLSRLTSRYVRFRWLPTPIPRLVMAPRRRHYWHTQFTPRGADRCEGVFQPRKLKRGLILLCKGLLVTFMSKPEASLRKRKSHKVPFLRFFSALFVTAPFRDNKLSQHTCSGHHFRQW